MPRMADFARLATAMAPGLGMPARRAVELICRNQQELDRHAVEASPVASAIERMMGEGSGAWEGTVGELYVYLDHHRDLRTPEAWPRSVHAFGNELRRIAPNLRRIGIEVERLPRSRDGHRVRLIKGL